MDKDSQVVIIGAGEIGRAIEKILSQKGIKANIWDKEPVPNQKSLAEIIPSADFLFICTPSQALSDVLSKVRAYLDKKTIAVSLSKGISENENKTADELLEQLLPDNQPFGLLGGPMIAEELMSGSKGFGTIATKHKETYTKLAGLFSGSELSVEYSDDVHGVALAGILKNIYAIALGIADGLSWANNKKGWLVSRALGEMEEITIILGGKGKTVYGLAGLGDLLATGQSPHSSNHMVGVELVKTGQVLKGEGSQALPTILSLLKGKGVFPILMTLEKIIIEKQNAKTVFEQLIVGGE